MRTDTSHLETEDDIPLRKSPQLPPSPPASSSEYSRQVDRRVETEPPNPCIGPADQSELLFHETSFFHLGHLLVSKARSASPSESPD